MLTQNNPLSAPICATFQKFCFNIAESICFALRAAIYMQISFCFTFPATPHPQDYQKKFFFNFITALSISFSLRFLSLKNPHLAFINMQIEVRFTLPHVCCVMMIRKLRGAFKKKLILSVDAVSGLQTIGGLNPRNDVV